MTSVVGRERSRVQVAFCVFIRVPLDTKRHPEKRGFSHNLRLYKIVETWEIFIGYSVSQRETHFAYKVQSRKFEKLYKKVSKNTTKLWNTRWTDLYQNRLKFDFSYSETPPYGHLSNMVTSLLRSLFSWVFWPPGKTAIHFLVKVKTLVNTATPLIRSNFLARWCINGVLLYLQWDSTNFVLT